MRAAVYVINLERSPDRLRHMRTQAARVALAFERLDGVDGETLSAAELDGYRAAHAPRPLTPGEVGCWLSHQRFWRALAAGDSPWGLVLEDDVALSAELPAA